MDGPRCGAIREELVRFAVLPLQPVVDEEVEPRIVAESRCDVDVPATPLHARTMMSSRVKPYALKTGPAWLMTGSWGDRIPEWRICTVRDGTNGILGARKAPYRFVRPCFEHGGTRLAEPPTDRDERPVRPARSSRRCRPRSRSVRRPRASRGASGRCSPARTPPHRSAPP
jgi:hypothetical protein